MGTFGFAEVGSSRVFWNGESVAVAEISGGGGPVDEIGFAELDCSSRVRVGISGSVDAIWVVEGGGPMAVSICCRNRALPV